MWDSIKRAGVDIHNILRRKLSFQDCFTDGGNLTTSGKLVLKDLAKFCNVNKSSMMIPVTGQVDALQMAFNEGKRAVYNRILKAINLDDEKIHKLYEEIE